MRCLYSRLTQSWETTGHNASSAGMRSELTAPVLVPTTKGADANGCCAMVPACGCRGYRARLYQNQDFFQIVNSSLSQQLAHEACGGCALERALPQLPRHFLVQRQRLGRRRDHGDTYADVRLLAQAKGGERQDLAVGLAEQLEARVRQRVRHDADLHPDGLVLDQRQKVLSLGARERAPLAPHVLGKPQP